MVLICRLQSEQNSVNMHNTNVKLRNRTTIVARSMRVSWIFMLMSNLFKILLVIVLCHLQKKINWKVVLAVLSFYAQNVLKPRFLPKQTRKWTLGMINVSSMRNSSRTFFFLFVCFRNPYSKWPYEWNRINCHHTFASILAVDWLHGHWSSNWELTSFENFV